MKVIAIILLVLLAVRADIDVINISQKVRTADNSKISEVIKLSSDSIQPNMNNYVSVKILRNLEDDDDTIDASSDTEVEMNKDDAGDDQASDIPTEEFVHDNDGSDKEDEVDSYTATSEIEKKGFYQPLFAFLNLYEENYEPKVKMMDTLNSMMELRFGSSHVQWRKRNTNSLKKKLNVTVISDGSTTSRQVNTESASNTVEPINPDNVELLIFEKSAATIVMQIAAFYLTFAA